MKPMPLNLKNAKKIHTDGKSSTFQLGSGHQIKIVHAALPALHKKQIEAMQVHKYADGGYADPSNSSVQPEPYDYVTNDDPTAPGAPALPSNGNQGVPSADQDAVRAPASLAGDAGDIVRQSIGSTVGGLKDVFGPVLSGVKDFGQHLLGTNAEANQTPAQSELPPPSTDLPGMGQPVGQPQGPQPASTPSSVIPGGSEPDISVGGIYQAGLKGLQAQQQAEAGYGQQAEQAEQEYQKQMADANARFQAIQTQNNADIDQTVHDMRTGAINPNHYMENMSVPSKIATAIGMILGGAGAGSGRPNPGAEFLNSQINRDIDAQKANLGEQNNILSAFQQKYQNNAAAESATRAAITANYASQLKAAADNTADPMAKARLLQGQAALMQQVYPLMMRANGLQFLQERQQQNAAGKLPPGQVDYPSMTVMQRIGIMPQPDVDAATKEAQEVETNSALKNDYIQSFNQLNKKIAAGSFTPADRDAYVNVLAARLQKAYSNRFNLDELKNIANASFPKIGDLPGTDKDKLQQGVQNIDGLMAATPTLYRYGLRSKASEQPQQSPQYRVGQILYNRGQKIQIIDNKGNYRAVR